MATNLRADEEIYRDILEGLKLRASLQPNEIGVMVKDGIVILTGWVDSYPQKLVAEEIAHHTQGVKAVVNEIEVHLPDSAERTDADIAAATTNALQSSPALSAFHIEVTVSKGWVILKGEVDDFSQKEEVEQTIHHISGIVGVSNLIKLKSQLLPAELQASIETMFIRNAEADAKNIMVEVERNKVRGHAECCVTGERKNRRQKSSGSGCSPQKSQKSLLTQHGKLGSVPLSFSLPVLRSFPSFPVRKQECVANELLAWRPTQS